MAENIRKKMVEEKGWFILPSQLSLTNNCLQSMLFFCGDDAKRVRQQQGLEASHVGKMISTRKTRKHVIQISDFSFKKATINNKDNE